MNPIAFTLSLAGMLTCTLAAAQTSRTDIPRFSETINSAAPRYWEANARGGVLTREQAARYWSNRPDGAALDFEALDVDGDGVASQSEWLGYHRGQAAAVSPGQ